MTSFAPSVASNFQLPAITLKISPRRNSFHVLLWAALAAVLTFFTFRSTIISVWRTGALFDTDDGIHLVQVRALLSGQNWFDMTIPRMGPPEGTFMHWSRLSDLPVAVLVELLNPIFQMPMAERIARLAVPFALLTACYLAMARLASRLLGAEARMPAIVACLLSGNGIAEFTPGRIDHHAPQILLLIVAVENAVAAFDLARARRAGLVGLLTGLSLAINLEDLPFLAVIGAGLFSRWIVVGDAGRSALGWYGCGMLIALPLFFMATTDPARLLLPVCDADSAAYVGAGLVAASGCICVALFGSQLQHVTARAATGIFTGVAGLTYVAVFYPPCLHDPFAIVDPLVREFWLEHVLESLPLATVLRSDSISGLCAALPAALGLACCLSALLYAPKGRQAGFGLVAAVVATGVALAFWQVRVLASIGMIAACGSLFIVLSVRQACCRLQRPALASISFCLILPFTATGIAAALSVLLSSPVLQSDGSLTAASFEQCLAPAAFMPMAHLTGRVVAPTDAGSFFLVHTDLDVFAAAFHRDNQGIRFAFDAMLAPEAQARKMVTDHRATLIAICPGLTETANLAARAPEGLANSLLTNRIPRWLEPVTLPGTPWRVYRVNLLPSSL